MAGDLKLEFAPLSVPPKGVLVLFCEEGLKLSAAARRFVAPTGDLVARAAAADRFKGKNGAALDIVAPPGLGVSRLIVVGVGKARELESYDFIKLGGVLMGKLPRSTSEATIVADLPGGSVRPDRATDLALGIKLRRYSFDRYKSKRKEDEEKPPQLKVIMAVAAVAGVQRAFAASDALADGVLLARDLVNEPANVLFPAEFARRAGELREARGRCQGARREGDEKARDECAARGRAGLSARESRGHHALERWQARHRDPSRSSARGYASIPGASRSSRPPVWRI